MTSPKPTIHRSSASSSSSPPTEWHVNPNKQTIKILEPIEEDLLSVSFLNLLDYLYPKNSHFYTSEYQTREYYEAILRETNSVEITHNFSKDNPSYITHSKARILKVINPEEWAIKPYSYKVLSSFPQYPVYNYLDYQDAWYYTFLLRSYTHSWFFYFNNQFASDYPRWFMKWFQYMGNIPEAFPPVVLEGLNRYKQMFAQENIPSFEYILQFSIIFRIPWISSFTYKKIEPKDSSPPIFYREYSVKWWKAMKTDQASVKAVINYYNETKQILQKPSSPLPPSPSHSLIQDQDTINRIQACSSPAEIQKILNEIKNSPSPSPPSSIQRSPSQDLYQDSQDPYDDIVL